MIILARVRFETRLRGLIIKKAMPPALSLAAMIWTLKLQSVAAVSPTSSPLSGGYCSSYSSCGGSGRHNHFTTPSQKQTSINKPNLPSEAAENDHPTELLDRLTPLQYHVTQQAGTERAFTGQYYNHKEAGLYTCIVCGTPLFSSDTKFDSGSGWPSFYAPFRSNLLDNSSGRDNDPPEEDHIVTEMDTSHGMVREEARCKKCGSHLGHVFDDGPEPTGRRYCINSAALGFKPPEDE